MTLRSYFKTVNMELTTIARARGKQDVHHLEKEDLVASTVEAAAMAGVPLAGTSWIPGRPARRFSSASAIDIGARETLALSRSHIFREPFDTRRPHRRCGQAGATNPHERHEANNIAAS